MVREIFIVVDDKYDVINKFSMCIDGYYLFWKRNESTNSILKI